MCRKRRVVLVNQDDKRVRRQGGNPHSELIEKLQRIGFATVDKTVWKKRSLQETLQITLKFLVIPEGRKPGKVKANYGIGFILPKILDLQSMEIPQSVLKERRKRGDEQ